MLNVGDTEIKKKLEPLYAWLLLTVMKKNLFMILAMISVFKTKNSVYNLMGCQLMLLKTRKYGRK